MNGATPFTPTRKGSGSSNQEVKERVQVIVRCRPPNSKERDSAVVVKTPSNKEVNVLQKLVHGKEVEKTFAFDQVYGPNTTQKDLFKTTIQPLVDEVLAGYNCTVFAYGQTSTGKTFTMEGDRNPKTNQIIDQKAGVIPRSIRHIFDTLEANKSQYTVRVSCLELYNEELQDLLAPEDSQSLGEDKKTDKLRIYDDTKKGTLVHGLEEIVVNDANHILSILDIACRKRQIAETQMNKHSSRSHVITCITIHLRESSEVEGEELIKIGKLYLVDLAGSENIGRSGAVNMRAKEAGMINQSLLTLGRVITALCNHQQHVPYRESKLTRLLQDSLGGRTKTCIIATISPSSTCIEETLSTLEYAHRAKNIQNKPEVNMKISKNVLIKELATDIEKLKEEVRAQRERNGGVFLTTEMFEQKEKLLKHQQEQISSLQDRVELLEKDVEEITNEKQSLSSQLESTQKSLVETEEMLELKKKEITSLIEKSKKLEYKISEQQFALTKTKEVEGTLYHQASDLLNDLHETRVDQDKLHLKIDNFCALETANIEKAQVLMEKINSQVQTIKQSNESFIEKQQEVHEGLKSLIASQVSDQVAKVDSLRKEISMIAQKLLETDIKANIQQELINYGYGMQQKLSFDNHLSFLDSMKDDLLSSINTFSSTIDTHASSLKIQVTEQYATLDTIYKSLVQETQELHSKLSQFLQEQVSSFDILEASVIQTYANKEIEKLKSQVSKFETLNHTFSQRQTEMKQSIIRQVSEMLDSQVKEQQDHFNTVVDDIIESVKQSQNSLQTNVVDAFSSSKLKPTLDRESVVTNEGNMLSQIESIGTTLQNSLQTEINKDRFKQLLVNVDSVNSSSATQMKNLLEGNHLPKLQVSIQGQKDFLTKFQKDFESKVSDACTSTYSRIGALQFDALNQAEHTNAEAIKSQIQIMQSGLIEYTRGSLKEALETEIGAKVTNFVQNKLKRLLPTGVTPSKLKKRRLIPMDETELPKSQDYELYAEEFAKNNEQPLCSDTDTESSTSETLSESKVLMQLDVNKLSSPRKLERSLGSPAKIVDSHEKSGRPPHAARRLNFNSTGGKIMQQQLHSKRRLKSLEPSKENIPQ